MDDPIAVRGEAWIRGKLRGTDRLAEARPLALRPHAHGNLAIGRRERLVRNDVRVRVAEAARSATGIVVEEDGRVWLSEFGARDTAPRGGDAVAVIVSEETGYISVAIDGRIDRRLSPDELRDRLRSLVTMRKSKRQIGARSLDV